MSERKPSLLIKDMLRCIEHVQLHTAGLTFDEFAGSFLVTEACLYNIQIIGEAVSKLPDDVRELHNDIPWQLIKGMRNRLIHVYFGTDLQLVWNVITNELPPLKTSLHDILTKLETQGR